jgi:hypothetical protein
MDKMREEFIRSIMISLKIEQSPFIVATVQEFTKEIKPLDYKNFMTSLFGTQHQYLNGMDRIAKVAEQFKPSAVEVNHIEVEAKRLIALAEALNSKIFEDSQRMKIQFSELINKIILSQSISQEDISVFNAVAPYRDAKRLISEINHYQDSKVQLDAFMSALKFGGQNALGGVTDKLRINRR